LLETHYEPGNFICLKNTDRRRALTDHRARIKCVDMRWIPIGPEEIFHRAFRNHESDACEISLGTHRILIVDPQKSLKD
jgi:hypothetical protein